MILCIYVILKHLSGKNTILHSTADILLEITLLESDIVIISLPTHLNYSSLTSLWDLTRFNFVILIGVINFYYFPKWLFFYFSLNPGVEGNEFSLKLEKSSNLVI